MVPPEEILGLFLMWVVGGILVWLLIVWILWAIGASTFQMKRLAATFEALNTNLRAQTAWHAKAIASDSKPQLYVCNNCLGPMVENQTPCPLCGAHTEWVPGGSS